MTIFVFIIIICHRFTWYVIYLRCHTLWSINRNEKTLFISSISLLLRFTEDEFDPEQSLTIGVDFKTKIVDIDGTFVKLGNNLIKKCDEKVFNSFIWFFFKLQQYGTQQAKVQEHLFLFSKANNLKKSTIL